MTENPTAGKPINEPEPGEQPERAGHDDQDAEPAAGTRYGNSGPGQPAETAPADA
jgi:hypothetical protein